MDSSSASLKTEPVARVAVSVPSQSGAPADTAEIAALLFAGFIGEADACQRLGLEMGDLTSLLDDLGLSNVAMIPVEVDEELNTYYVDLGTSAFDAPLFDDVIDRSRATGTTRGAVGLQIPANAIFGAAATSQRSHLRGLVFHVGRCGSTLLCNLLASVHGWVALREPEFVNALLLRLVAERDAVNKDRLGALVALLLRSLGHGARLDTDGSPRACVVKLSSWNAMLADQFVWRMDGIPLVVLTRDPCATVASFLRDPPYWYSHQPALAAGSPTRASRLAAARFFAEAWCRTIDQALRFPPLRTLFVNYTEVVENPLSVLVTVYRHLGDNCASPDVRAIHKVMRRYSKGATEEPFEPQSKHRRDTLEPELRDLVTDITAVSCSALVDRMSPNRFRAG